MHIKVKVTTGAKKEKIEIKKQDVFVITVGEKAERNMANKRVRELVAEHFKVSIGKVKIISGHHSPSKILEVGGISG